MALANTLSEEQVNETLKIKVKQNNVQILKEPSL